MHNMVRTIFVFYVIQAIFLGCMGLSVKTDASEEIVSQHRLAKKPNILVLLVDDLGIGDIGCFGNDTIKTPSIDRLASLGAKLNHNLAPGSICTPSRAATLTGRYAVRSGMAAGPNEFRAFGNLGAPGGLPTNEITLGKMLQDSSYKTSFIGKWHLGLNCNNSKDGCHHPMNMGFDEFYGLPLTNLRDCGPREQGSSFFRVAEKYGFKVMVACVTIGFALAFTGLTSKRFAVLVALFPLLTLLAIAFIVHILFQSLNCILMRGFDVVEQPTQLENLTVKFTNEAKSFIHTNRENPFLLFMSYAKVHAVLFTSPAFKGHSVHGRYGDNVEEMDWSVGEIVGALEKEKILEDTFVYFTSDHGPFLEIVLPSGEHLGGWSGQYRGGKGQSWEGGIRVPTIAVWKNHIPPGIVINEPTNTMDIFPTIGEICGANVPNDRIIDGRNILPLLKQEQSISPHQFMFHYCGTAIHAVRYRPRTGNVVWKAHYVTPKWAPGKECCPHMPTMCRCFGDEVNIHNPPLLYDIAHDPYETTSLDPSVPEHKSILEKMNEAIEKHKAGVKPVTKQLGYPHSWWRPHLQPCCNFPYCSCVET